MSHLIINDSINKSISWIIFQLQNLKQIIYFLKYISSVLQLQRLEQLNPIQIRENFPKRISIQINWKMLNEVLMVVFSVKRIIQLEIFTVVFNIDIKQKP